MPSLTLSGERVAALLLQTYGYEANPTYEQLPDVFVKTKTVGGNSNLYVPVRGPIVRISVLVKPTDNSAPAFGRASAEMERIHLLLAAQRPVTVSDADRIDFHPVRIQYVNPVSEPVNVTEPTNIARFEADYQFSYVSIQ